MAKKTNYTKNGFEYYRLTKTIAHKADVRLRQRKKQKNILMI